MGKKTSKKNDRDKNRIIFLMCAVVLFVIILFSTVFGDWLQIMDNRRQAEELASYKVLLLEEEASLKSEVTKLHDPEYIARYAREKYMYTKDGETILKIVDGQVVKEAE